MESVDGSQLGSDASLVVCLILKWRKPCDSQSFKYQVMYIFLYLYAFFGVCMWVCVLFDMLLKAQASLCGGLVLLSDNQEADMFS